MRQTTRFFSREYQDPKREGERRKKDKRATSLSANQDRPFFKSQTLPLPPRIACLVHLKPTHNIYRRRVTDTYTACVLHSHVCVADDKRARAEAHDHGRRQLKVRRPQLAEKRGELGRIPHVHARDDRPNKGGVHRHA